MIMELSNYAKVFKALSNEQRLRIFMIIYTQCCMPENSDPATRIVMDDNTCCCKVSRTLQKAFTKVCDCMNLSRSTVSHHFKELQNAGLIECQRDGQTFRCRVNGETVDALRDFLTNPHLKENETIC